MGNVMGGHITLNSNRKKETRMILYLCNGFAKSQLYFFWLGCLCSDTLTPLFDEAKQPQKYTYMLISTLLVHLEK